MIYIAKPFCTYH